MTVTQRFEAIVASPAVQSQPLGLTMKNTKYAFATILTLGLFGPINLFGAQPNVACNNERSELIEQAPKAVFGIMTAPIVIWGINEYKAQLDELKTRGIVLKTNSTSNFFRTDNGYHALKADFIDGRKMELIFDPSSTLVVYCAMYENPWEREWLNSETAKAMFSNREFTEMSVQEELKMMVEHQNEVRKNKSTGLPPYQKLDHIPEKMRAMAVPSGMEIVEVWHTNNRMALLIGCIKKTDCGAYMTFYLSRISNRKFFE